MTSRPSVLSRRGLLQTSAVTGFTLWVLSPSIAHATPSGGARVVRNNTPMATIVIPEDPHEAVVEAATIFQTYVRRASGVELPIGTQRARGSSGSMAIHIGQAAPDAERIVEDVWEGVTDGVGFVRHSGPRSVTILGARPWETLNGVLSTLEESLGVRWLMPTVESGDQAFDGDHVPQIDSWSIPFGTVLGLPAMKQRVFSPLFVKPGTGGLYPQQYRWAQRNQLQGDHNKLINFHHNLHTFFPVEVYGDRPELYANGIVPAAGVTTAWQPAFSNPETVDIVVAAILQQRADDPGLASVSLGVNDGAYTSYEEGLPIPQTYYSWVNDVVEQVVALEPDLRFGLLAYHELEVPPAFALHPAVVPFLTEDRYGWVVDEVREARIAQLEAWHDVATEIGTYDYLYGSPYAIPRIYTAVLADAYRTSHALGVRHHYAELYPNWGEGPKPWLAARLARDPEADPDALVQDWCHAAVGDTAGAHLADYYRLWEQVWTGPIAEGPWLIPGRTYQPFDNPGYLAAVSPAVLDEAAELMDLVVATSGNGSQSDRAAKLAAAHQYYDYTARLYPREVAAPQDAAAALELAETMLASVGQRQQLLSDREAWLAASASDPLLIQPLNPTRGGLTGLSAYNHYEVWGLITYLQQHESAGGQVTDWLLTHRDDDEIAAQLVDVTLAGAAAEGSLVTNPGFEDAMSDWTMWVTDYGSFDIAPDGRSGQGLRATGVTRGGPIQDLAVSPGCLITRLWVKAGPEVAGGTIQIAMNLFNSAGARVGTVRGEALSLAAFTDDWHAVTSLDVFASPSDPAQAVSRAEFVPTLTDVPEGVEVRLDDVEAYLTTGSAD